MKRIIAFLLALMLCIGIFAACGKTEKEPEKVEDPSGSETPDEPSEPKEPEYVDPLDPSNPAMPVDASKAEPYIVVANDKWAVVSSFSLAADSAPAGWYDKKPDLALKGLTGYKAGAMTNLAPEDCIIAVKKDKVEAYGTGDLGDEDMIIIELKDEKGNFVGKEVLLQLNGTDVVGIQYSGNSVVGALEITKDGDKFTAKIGDKVYLNGASATDKLATRAYDAVPVSAWYVSAKTMKAVFAYGTAHNFDLQLAFGNDERDVTQVGLFYDEFYNFNYEGDIDGYDWDGDGKLDLVMVNRPTTGKVYDDAAAESMIVAVAGDNKGYCGTRSYRTNSTLTAQNDEFPAALRKNEMIFIYEDYRIDKRTVVRLSPVRGVLNSVDIEGGKAVINGKEYNLDNSGELPYVNGLSVTKFNAGGADQEQWIASVQKGVTVYVDSLNNILAAVLPNIE